MLTGAFLKHLFTSLNVIHAIVLIYQTGKMSTCEKNDPSPSTHGKGINKKRNWRFKVNLDAKRDKL